MKNENSKQKKIVYVDMDNVLVDFKHGIDCLSEEDRLKYDGRYDDCPGIFSLMRPMPDAIESYHELTKYFDVYILSTSPWDNPSAWQHKVEWVQKHLGQNNQAPGYKRLVLSHHKHLNRGDFLIDDRTANGADKFEGEHIHFGTEEFPDWKSVVEYLKKYISATLEDAIAIAAKAHCGQKDKAGSSYILHPLRMMMKMKSESAMMAAVLHDVVEDTNWTLDKLRQKGFSKEVLDAVDCLTKRPGEEYEDFVERVKTSRIAREVKIADLEDNMNIQRINQIKPSDLERLEKYHKYWTELKALEKND